MGFHDEPLRDPVGKNPTVNFGVVFYALEQYGNLVHALSDSPFVAQTDFTYGAPVYKGSLPIKAGLATADSALEKFDVYFQNAVLDEVERARFARLFRAQYIAKFPASERQDLFVASGELLKFGVELVPPHALEHPGDAINAVERTPHDPSVLRSLKEGKSVDRAHLRGDMKLFFDHVMNPRRREAPQVARAAMEMGTEEPYVIELVTNGAMPGYVFYVLQPLVHRVGGRLVLLEAG